MTEFLSHSNDEFEVYEKLTGIARSYLADEEAGYLDDLESLDDQKSYVYERLLDLGLDPDDIFYEAGLIEGRDYEV